MRRTTTTCGSERQEWDRPGAVVAFLPCAVSSGSMTHRSSARTPDPLVGDAPPEPVYDLVVRASDFLRRGHPHQAALLLSRAKLAEPEKGSIREALGRALYLSGRTAGARREFAKAVQLDPVNDYAHFGLALCCARTGSVTGRSPTSSSPSPCARCGGVPAGACPHRGLTPCLPVRPGRSGPNLPDHRPLPRVRVRPRRGDLPGRRHHRRRPTGGRGASGRRPSPPVRDQQLEPDTGGHLERVARDGRGGGALGHPHLGPGHRGPPGRQRGSRRHRLRHRAARASRGPRGLRDPGHRRGARSDRPRGGGVGSGLDYAKLRRAGLLVQRGAQADRLQRRRRLPGAGRAVAGGRGDPGRRVTTTGATPEGWASRPRRCSSPRRRRLAGRRSAGDRDRLDTDVAGAEAVGWDSLLVLSGVSTRADLLRSPTSPAHVAGDVGGLLEDRPEGRFRAAERGDVEGIVALLQAAGLQADHPEDRLDTTAVFAGPVGAGSPSETHHVLATAAVERIGTGRGTPSVGGRGPGGPKSGLGALAVAHAVRTAPDVAELFLFTEGPQGSSPTSGSCRSSGPPSPRRWPPGFSATTCVDATAMAGRAPSSRCDQDRRRSRSRSLRPASMRAPRPRRPRTPTCARR